jgi:hypothetical protein
MPDGPLVAEAPAGPASGARRWFVALPLVVLLGLLLADRLMVGVVERRLSAKLACLGALTGPGAVHIGGFPFLTQVAAGHFRVVTVTADGVGDAARLTDVDVTFRDVRMPPLSDCSASLRPARSRSARSRSRPRSRSAPPAWPPGSAREAGCSTRPARGDSTTRSRGWVASRSPSTSTASSRCRAGYASR